MDNHSGINLSKKNANSWTDPITGEIYPYNPNSSEPEPNLQQESFAQKENYGFSSYQTADQYKSRNMETYQSADIMPNNYQRPQMQNTNNYGNGYNNNYNSSGYNNASPYKTVNNAQSGFVGTNTKYCSHCGNIIAAEAVICPQCGCQVAEFKSNAQAQPIYINNNVNAVNTVNAQYGKRKNKWVAFVLCLFLGCVGAHKFYEGKVGMGILYICTCGLLGIGVFVDLIRILTKPNPYYLP